MGGGGGRLGGIARHGRPGGPMETLGAVRVTRASGIDGDCRGLVRPGGGARRQVSLIEAAAWEAALGELGIDPRSLPWWHRRANLLIEGVRLPRREGARIRIGDDVVVETVQECDPCSRMDRIAPGLMAALTPDWRGGVLGRVIAEGAIAVGDNVRIEE